MKMMMASVQWPVWLMLMMLCWEHCVGQKGAADQAGDHTMLYSHLVLLDSLPTGINALSPLDLVIRTNYSGRVEFQEADSFRILLNISSPTIEETYTVVSALSEDKGRLLLQVYNEPIPVPNISLDWICIVIVGLTGIVLIVTTIFAVWWYTTKQYFEMFSGSHNHILYRAAQAGDLPTAQGDLLLLGEDDLGGDVTTTDYHVLMPELPEEEEEEEEEGADIIRMEMLRTHGSVIRTENYPDNSGDEDDDTTFIKSRMTSTVNKSHQVWTEKQHDKGVERTQGHDRIGGVLKYFTDQSEDERTEVYNDSAGVLKYPADQSEDELEDNALQSPDQKIADADGDYTPLDDLDDLVDMSGVHENKSARKQQDEVDSGQPSHSDHAIKREGSKKRHISTPDANSCRSNREPSYVNLHGGQMGLPVLRPVDDTNDIYSYLRVDGSSIQSQPPFLVDERMGSFPSKNDTQVFSSISPLDGQYIRLKPVPSKVKLKPKNVPCPTVDSYSNDTLMTFKSSNSALSKQTATAKPIPVPKKSESKGHLGFGDASPVGHTVHPLLLSEPRSPGTFSMLSDGSNEIFETRDFDVDDLENPQKDADMMSNASLPLPSPPVHSQFDPYDTPMISQLSPRQSYISASPGDFWTGTCIALTGSPSPGISFKSKDEARDSGIVSSNQAIAQQEETRFVFPPAPPSPAHVIYSSQTRRQLYLDEQRRDDLCPSLPGGTNSSMAYTAGTIAENVSSEADRFQREGGANRKRGRGGKGKLSMLHISVLCSLCLFGVMTGVFCRTAQGTTVDIIVFSPAKFLSNNVSIYMARNKLVEVEPGSHLYEQFESDNPILWRRNSTLCETSHCAQGCDDNTGHCICRKGFIMSKDGRCEDINECTEGVGTCDISAGCFNKMGSYECLCAGDYYGDGKSCKECLSPCPVGKFEVQPCDTKHNKQKICKDCTTSCTDGYYMSKLCEKDKDADCRMCQSRCLDNEFEYRQCSTDQNRECRVKVSLAAPKMSENILFEDIQKVHDAKSEPVFYPNSDKLQLLRFVLDRGTDDSGTYIDVTVSYMNLAAKFQSVNQSINTHMNQPDRQQGTNEVRQKFCSSPLPQHFQLTYQIHKDVLFQKKNGRLEACGKDNGFPNRLADSMLCSEPSPLSNVFHMNETTFNPTVSVWIQKSETCTRKHEECETCYRLLGFSMKNSQDCVIRREEHQSEISPRLQLCYSCAAKNSCSAVCKDYHGKDCRMIRCERGNLVQYSLTPVYPAGQKFLCYVKPVMGQRLIQVSYSIKKHSAILLKGSLTVETDEEWKETGKIERRDNIIRVSIDSMLTNMPNLVQGEIVNHSKHQAGFYQPQGTKLEQTKVDTHSIPVQPSSPFGFSPSVFGTTGCGNEDISSLIVARDDPILVLSGLTVQHVDLDASYYITNNSHPPKVVISVDRSTSILKAIYPTGELKHNTLKAHLSLQANHWLLNVTGELLFIPGVININISDPFYKSSTLYQYELAVNGTPMFFINFSIATGDLPTVSKSFLIRVQDRVSTQHLIAHRPAPDVKAIRAIEQSHEESSFDGRERSMSMPNPPHFSILFIASVSGAICLLLFILMVGVVLEQGIPDGNIQRFQVRHLVLLVIYIVFQFLYALVVSMTVFLFVVIAINGETAMFLQQYNQHRLVKTDVTQLELDHMQHHLEAEVARLNNITDSRRKTCEEKIQLIRNDFTNLKDVIMRRSQENLKQQDLKNLINEHMRRVTEKFSENLSVFRQKFEAEKQFMIRKLVSDIQNTYKTIQHNKWLAGVTYLYNDVVNTHLLFNSSSVIKPFMEWADLDMDISDLTSGISLPLPRMPSLDPHLHGEHPDIQQTSPSSPGPIPLKTEKKNLWYLYSKMNNMSQNMSEGQASNTSQRTTKFSTGIYTMFFACMVCIDFFWFLHRMIKSVAVGRLLLYGYPVYVDARDRKDDALPSGDNGQKNIKGKCYSSPRNKFCKFARVVASKAMSSLFIPKMIGTIFVCLLVYMISITSMKFINRQTFSYLGYYNNMDDLLKVNELFINVRLQAHADHINQLEFPIYSSMMTAHVQHNQYLQNLLKTQRHDIEDFHTYTYCHYLKQMTVNARCGNTYDENGLLEVSVEQCTFEPIQIQRYKRAITSSTRTREAQMDSFLRNIQQLISNTCHVILVYLAVIILKDLLGTVLWIYIKRSGVISLRIIYETDNAPDTYTAAESTTNRAAQ